MLSQRVQDVVTYLNAGGQDFARVQELTIEELGELIPRMSHHIPAPFRTGVQEQLNQLRLEEAAREQRAAFRLNAWQLLVALVSAFLTGAGVGLAWQALQQ